MKEYKKLVGIYKIEYKNTIYIGQSSSLGHRWETHLSALRNNKHDNNRLQNIYNKYGIDSLTFSVIELCEESVLTDKEQGWVNFYKENKSFDVLNVGEFVDSSMRGRHHTKSTKEKICNSKLGKSLSKQHKLNIGKGNKGKKCSEETRRKMSKAQKGIPKKKHTEEWKKRNSELQKGRIKSNEECKRISESKMGHKVSKETRRKISQSLMGNIPWNKKI